MAANTIKEAARTKDSTPRTQRTPQVRAVEQSSGAAAPGKYNGEERRRSQRVLLRIRASVHVNLHGQQTSLEIRTLSVNPFGAMIIAGQNLPAETRLVLENSVTHERVACRVVHAAKEMPEGFHVPVEFDSPAPHFWMIDFPPDDWKPQD